MINPTPPPQGSLEDLFRHHLLESAAAVVPPRKQVWENIEHQRLLTENQRYQRRLRTHRWALAASLLLASLASTGWWQSQRQPTTPRPSAARRVPNHAPLTTGASATSVINQPFSSALIAQPVTFPASALPVKTASPNRRARRAASALTAGRMRRATDFINPTQPGARTGRPNSSAAPIALAGSTPAAGQSPGAALTSVNESSAAVAATAGPAAELPPTSPAMLAGTDAPAAEALLPLASRSADLQLLTAALPATLSAPPLPEWPVPTEARRWQFGLAYAATVFQPNIDFGRATDAYNPALGTRSAALTQAAAAEYRAHLRPGLGQRLSGWATRRLGRGRWGLRTGLEVSQQTATSATSAAFVGEQVADLGYLNAPSSLRATTFRYRAASVPVEVHYRNPTKTGLSLYGRVGALFTTLFHVRSEVTDNPEASRTYNLRSANNPYRPLTGSLRGTMGVQFRPAGREWALSFGPVAEVGIWSLNADPQAGFWHQARPYSLGLEAGLELGRSPHQLGLR